MKPLLKKLALFCFIPFVVWGIADAVTPLTYFTYRSGEGFFIHYKNRFQGAFYHDEYNEMTAVGDLCHHTKYAVPRKEIWKTDKMGFRNDAYIENPDVIIIGDSFMAGLSLTQGELFSNELKRNMPQLSFYNMAPSTFTNFNSLLECGMINKPKIIVFSIVERNVPSKLSRSKGTKLLYPFSGLLRFDNMYIDKALKRNSLQWMRARVHGNRGVGKSSADGEMYFLKGTAEHTPEELQDAADRIISYKNYCDEKGINFLFVPMPDKESVYYDKIPLSSQPSYLFQLDAMLKKAGVRTINTLQIYNDYRKENANLLYHTDDTHWNPTAVSLVAKAVQPKITEFYSLSSK